MESTINSMNAADLRTKHSELCKCLLDLNETIDVKLKLLEDKEKHWSETMASVAHDADSGKDKVKLNVGGCMFETSRSTLLQGERTNFHALLGNPGLWQPCEKDGAYFIDRDPELFQRVFASIRFQEPIDTSGLSAIGSKRLRTEADYYQLTESSMQLPSWDRMSCGCNLTLTEQDRVVVKSSGGSRYNSAVICKNEVASFTVRVKDFHECGDIAVGFTNPLGFDGNAENNLERTGSYHLHCGDGGLSGGIGGDCREVGAPTRTLGAGTVIKCQLDRAASKISFLVDGVEHPSMCDILGCEVLVPCVEIVDQGGCVSLEMP